MIGVYALFDGKEIVYIGQTKNIDVRIRNHKSTNKKFTHHRVIECHEDKLRHYESRLIRFFKPKYNKAGKYLPNPDAWKKHTAISIDEKELAKLKKEAKAQHRSLTNYIETLLLSHPNRK